MKVRSVVFVMVFIALVTVISNTGQSQEAPAEITQKIARLEAIEVQILAVPSDNLEDLRKMEALYKEYIDILVENPEIIEYYPAADQILFYSRGELNYTRARILQIEKSQ